MDNRLMLERLAKVVQHKTIDNEIHKSVAMHATFKKKLGLTKKRLEMQKITEENQRLLKRIQEVPVSKYVRNVFPIFQQRLLKTCLIPFKV
jgi:hypothetical protein